MVPRARLVKKILKRLGSWQAGQDLPPEDFQAIDEDLDQVLLAMGRADIYVVEVPAEGVPDEAYAELAAYLAGEFADDFGLTGDEAEKIGARAAAAEKALRYLRTSRPTFQILATDSF